MSNLSASQGAVWDSVPTWVGVVFLVCVVASFPIVRHRPWLPVFREAVLWAGIATAVSTATGSPTLVTVCVLGLVAVTLGGWYRLASISRSERRGNEQRG